MIYSVERPTILKRIPTVIDRTQGIQAYDADNLYPQRVEEIRKRSLTVTAAVAILAEFINGEGFQDKMLGNTIVNDEQMTMNDVLNFISEDKAEFRGFALHFQYDLNYRISAINPIRFKNCRFGLPDSDGHVWDIKYSRNWERDFKKTIDNQIEIISYPTFDPNPETVRMQIEQYGAEFYPGQIWLWTPEPGIYPSCSYDTVLDQAQTQAEIALFDVSSAQQGFTAGTILRYPGSFTDDESRNKFKRKLAEHKGGIGGNSIMVVEDPSGGEDKRKLVETIQMQNTDKLHEFTSKKVKTEIREAFSQPAPLLGQLPDSGMFNQEDMVNSYTYYNAVTRGHRKQLSDVFKRIFRYSAFPTQAADFTITAQQYLTNG